MREVSIPSQLLSFFITKPEKIEEAIRTLDMAEDIANVGPRRKKRVDSSNELAIVFKSALATLGFQRAARSRWTDADDISVVLAIRLE